MPGLIKVSYVNASGAAIPPWGIVQLNGPVYQTGTGDYVVQAVLPGVGDGPYMIDDGKGTAVSGPASFGSCFRAVEGFAWVAYGCTAPPSAPWQKVGPIIGSPWVSTLGDGYYYAGQYDASNSRILCMVSTLATVATNCTGQSSSTSYSSSGGSGSSGTSTSSSPCGCVTVVTGVSCSGGSLSVTYGSARGCC